VIKCFTEIGHQLASFAPYLCNANKKNRKMKTKKNVFESNTKQQVTITIDGTYLSISGNSISLQPEINFNPLIEWIKAFKGETLKIDINLDLINCRSVKLLVKAMRTFDNNGKIKNKLIFWYFKDEEDKELGDTIESSLRNTKVKFFCIN
jgi:hypothetical protein